MKYKSKKEEIIDYIYLEIIEGKLKENDRFYEKRFFTSLFKVNPNYVEDVYKDLCEENIITKKDENYYIIAGEDKKNQLKEEFLHQYISEFLEALSNLDISNDYALEVLENRISSNG